MSMEIDWTDAPKTDRTLPAAELRRCRPGGEKPVIVLSDWIIGNEVHWFNGRSYPHLRNDCPACAAKRSKVWKGYLACLDPTKRSIFIMEITQNCLEAASHYKQNYGTLRGAQLTLNRSATKANGRVTATFVPANLAGLDLPETIDVRGILERMWQTDHRPTDRKPEDPRPVTEGPDPNPKPRPTNGHRFTTEGSPRTPVYETTPAQREMLKRNAEANASTAPAGKTPK